VSRVRKHAGNDVLTIQSLFCRRLSDDCSMKSTSSAEPTLWYTITDAETWLSVNKIEAIEQHVVRVGSL
jgi:hypothetical protein